MDTATNTTEPAMNTWKIEIEFSENDAIGAVAETGTTWSTFESFTSLISALAHTAPGNGGGYNKTYVEITHIPSGERYDLRLDIKAPGSSDTSDNDLLKRVRSMCDSMLDNDPAITAEWAKWAERFKDAK